MNSVKNKTFAQNFHINSPSKNRINSPNSLIYFLFEKNLTTLDILLPYPSSLERRARVECNLSFFELTEENKETPPFS